MVIASILAYVVWMARKTPLTLCVLFVSSSSWGRSNVGLGGEGGEGILEVVGEVVSSDAE